MIQAGSLEEKWQQWKLNYNKYYNSIEEEQECRNVWMQTYHQIWLHNKAEGSFYIELNQFADMVLSFHKVSCSVILILL